MAYHNRALIKGLDRCANSKSYRFQTIVVSCVLGQELRHPYLDPIEIAKSLWGHIYLRHLHKTFVPSSSVYKFYLAQMPRWSRRIFMAMLARNELELFSQSFMDRMCLELVIEPCLLIWTTSTMMPGVGILSTPTIAKADGVFTIRATSTIDATAQEVYERLLDVDRYAAWNTFTPHVQRTSCVSPEQLNVQDQITLEANIGCECLITSSYAWNPLNFADLPVQTQRL